MRIDILKKELEEINTYIDQIERIIALEGNVEPKKIIISGNRGKSIYILVDENKKHHYIKSKDMDIVKQHVRLDYNSRVKNKLYEQQKLLEYFIKKYEENPLDTIYEKFCDGRKRLIVPLIDSKQQFIKKWYEQHPGNQNTYETPGVYCTKQGEYVRSKSEKILADLFYDYGVPYQYEPAFQVFNHNTYYPDFVLLNIRERKTYYWEHFGLGSDKLYSDKNFEKLSKYEKSGLVLGENLLVSIEAKDMVLDVKAVEEKIKKYLL